MKFEPLLSGHRVGGEWRSATSERTFDVSEGRDAFRSSPDPYFRRDLAVGCIGALRHTEALTALRTGRGPGSERAEALSSAR
jgi:hypothetical protein